jgi:hypothetical protein
VLAEGDALGGQTTPISGTVAAGATYDLQLKLVAPDTPGTYHGIWQMTNPQGTAFGERLDVAITVPAAPTATPLPSPTAAPNVSFTANPMATTQGQQVTFTWSVSQSRAQYFYRQGDNWAQYPVGPSASRVAWPEQTTTWELRVVNLDGTVQIQPLTIQVAPAPGAPVIVKFTLNPPAQVMLGACVDIAWLIDKQLTEMRLYRGEAVILDEQQAQGHTTDCPPSAGTVTYRLEAIGPDGTARASRDLNVLAGTPTATALPPGVATPSTAPQVLNFAVDPSQIPAGQCVTIQWQVRDASLVRIRRGTGVVLDYAPLSGSTYDCPISPGTVTYRIEAVNQTGQAAFSDDVVTVTGPR